MTSGLIKVGRFLFVTLSAAVLAVLVLLYIQGCSGPALKPWHTEKLDADFTRKKIDTVSSFDDYRRLEDTLFAQLDTDVYAQTATGPEYALVRYSRGSAADPQTRNPNWNRSFELRVDQSRGAVLLLHGMSDSPYSLRALGISLHRRGYQVLGLRLPGHGTAPSGLIDVNWRDMAAVVVLAMRHLESQVGNKPIHIIGYSTGAPLALDYVLDTEAGNGEPAAASLVLISPAIGISPAAALAQWKRRLSGLPGLGSLAWLQVQPEFDPYKYNSFTTNAGEQVHSLTRTVSRRIAGRNDQDEQHKLPSILVLKSTVDATVSIDAVINRLLRPLTPNRHELILFDINRFAKKSSLLITDPGPITARVMDDETLPFAVTLVTNESLASAAVVARHKAAFSSEITQTDSLQLKWPPGVISLSHVALPFPPDDPLYGQRPDGNDEALFLGEMAIQGERGLLKIPADWLMRLRYNPFYDYLERQVIDWVDGKGQ